MLWQGKQVNQATQGLVISLAADSGSVTKAHTAPLENITPTAAVDRGESVSGDPANRTADNPNLSEKIREALAEDPDPAKSLAEVRRILIGPTQRLHEARTEELVSIMEEYDSSVQQSLSSLEKRCSHLIRSSEKLLTVSENLQRNLYLQSDYVNSEFRKVNGEQQKLVVDLINGFNMRLAEVAAELKQELDSNIADCHHRDESLTAELSKQIAQLATQVSASNQEIESAVEPPIAQSEAQQPRRHLEVFTAGFCDIADRLLALRSSHPD